MDEASLPVAPALPAVSESLSVLLPEPSSKGSGPAWSTRVEQALAGLEAAPMIPARDRSLSGRLGKVLSRSDSRSTVAMHVRDLEDGRVLFDRRGGWHLNPASNQKILTAHAAVELLGPDYRFKTQLLREGNTLYLRGEGDPSLSLAALDSMLRAAHGRGELAGIDTLAIDDSAFSEARFAPGVEAHAGEAAYLAPTGAVSMNFNTVELTVRPGAQPGAPVELEIFPPSDGVELVNAASTGRGELRIESEALSDGRTRVRVEGRLPTGARAKNHRRRIHDPARFVAGAITHLAAEFDPAQRWTVTHATVPAGARRLASNHSDTLVDVLSASMKYSNNFTTEQVLRTLAWRASGRPGSWDDGVEVLRRFTQRVAAVEDEAHFVNGSGLSHEGRVSPRMIVDLISLSAEAGSPSESLLASYARAGGEGTLHYRNAAAGSRVRAKTGTLAGVSALSGVVYSRDGSRRIGFSLLVNGADASDSRAMQDRAVGQLLDWLDAQQ